MPRQVVIVDTREKNPYSFSSRVSTQRGTLRSGDYSLLGLESTIAVERKSLADLVNTVIGNRDRWRRELARLWGYRFAAVVVEACAHDILAGNWKGGALPNSVLGAMVNITVEFGIPVVLAGDRATAERVTEAMLLMAAKVHGSQLERP
jgi:DNA excision repair protein ERCC-4